MPFSPPLETFVLPRGAGGGGGPQARVSSGRACAHVLPRPVAIDMTQWVVMGLDRAVAHLQRRPGYWLACLQLRLLETVPAASGGQDQNMSLFARPQSD